MNKALMISIQPQHAVNILNGDKTLELRTWIPKDFKGWVYIYCTKGVGKTKYHHLYNLTSYNNGKTLFSITHHNKYSLVPDGFLNGKVVARFWFDEYEEIKERFNGDEYIIEKLDELCLSDYEVKEYLGNKKGYAWHIEQLEIFDEPKQLSEFYVTNKGLTYKYIKEYEDYTNDEVSFRLKKAPQKMQWVYIKEKENELIYKRT